MKKREKEEEVRKKKEEVRKEEVKLKEKKLEEKKETQRRERNIHLTFPNAPIPSVFPSLYCPKITGTFSIS